MSHPDEQNGRARRNFVEMAARIMPLYQEDWQGARPDIRGWAKRILVVVSLFCVAALVGLFAFPHVRGVAEPQPLFPLFPIFAVVGLSYFWGGAKGAWLAAGVGIALVAIFFIDPPWADAIELDGIVSAGWYAIALLIVTFCLTRRRQR